MKTKSEVVKRIPSYFAGSDCVLMTFGFRNNILCFSDDDVLCHYDFKGNSQNINKYLSDDRRKIFPYGDIPIYMGLLKINYVNQLLEYNKHYIVIRDGHIDDIYIVREGNNAIVLDRPYKFNKYYGMFMDYNELGFYFESKDIKKIFNSMMNNDLYKVFDRYGREYCNDIDGFIKSGGGVLVFKDNNEFIIMKIVEIYVSAGYDSYFYREYDMPLNDYRVEELKYFNSKIKMINKPNVSLKYNPNIDRDKIREAKRLVRKIK